MSNPIDDLMGKLVACHIDRAMSSCLEMVSELMYMRTIDADTTGGHDQLMGRLDEIVDMNKSLIDELRQVNDLI